MASPSLPTKENSLISSGPFSSSYYLLRYGVRLLGLGFYYVVDESIKLVEKLERFIFKNR